MRDAIGTRSGLVSVFRTETQVCVRVRCATVLPFLPYRLAPPHPENGRFAAKPTHFYKLNRQIAARSAPPRTASSTITKCATCAAIASAAQERCLRQSKFLEDGRARPHLLTVTTSARAYSKLVLRATGAVPFRDTGTTHVDISPGGETLQFGAAGLLEGVRQVKHFGFAEGRADNL